MTRATEILHRLQPVLDAVPPSDVFSVSAEILAARRVFLLGAGQTGLVLRGLAMRLTQAGLTAHIPGDCTTPAITSGDLLLAASCSGNRPGMLALARAAAEAGAPLTVLTAAADSPLAQLARQTLVIPADREQNVPQHGQPLVLGTCFELSLYCICVMIAEEVLRARGESPASLRQRHANLE